MGRAAVRWGVFFATASTDMRRGFNALEAMVRETFGTPNPPSRPDNPQNETTLSGHEEGWLRSE